jgi:hypothetical protein
MPSLDLTSNSRAPVTESSAPASSVPVSSNRGEFRPGTVQPRRALPRPRLAPPRRGRAPTPVHRACCAPRPWYRLKMTEGEEDGTSIISPGVEERSRWESLILKKFVYRVSIVWRDHELGVKSRETVESNWVPTFYKLSQPPDLSLSLAGSPGVHHSAAYRSVYHDFGGYRADRVAKPIGIPLPNWTW